MDMHVESKASLQNLKYLPMNRAVTPLTQHCHMKVHPHIHSRDQRAFMSAQNAFCALTWLNVRVHLHIVDQTTYPHWETIIPVTSHTRGIIWRGEGLSLFLYRGPFEKCNFLHPFPLFPLSACLPCLPFPGKSLLSSSQIRAREGLRKWKETLDN